TWDQSCGNWIEGCNEHHRDMASGVPGREDRRCTSRNNDVGLGACELDRRFGYSRSALRQRELNDELPAFNESLFLKSFPEAPDVSGGRWPNADAGEVGGHLMTKGIVGREDEPALAALRYDRTRGSNRLGISIEGPVKAGGRAIFIGQSRC